MCTNTHVCMCMRTRTCAHSIYCDMQVGQVPWWYSAHIHTRTHIHTHAHTHTHKYIHIQAHTHAHTHTHKYTHIQAHTRTHTCTQVGAAALRLTESGVVLYESSRGAPPRRLQLVRGLRNGEGGLPECCALNIMCVGASLLPGRNGEGGCINAS